MCWINLLVWNFLYSCNNTVISRNNGVITRVKKIPNEKINPAHTISVSCGGSVMECFYQDEEYYSGRDLYYLKPKIKLNTQQMIFYASVISSNRYKFSYS